MLLAYAFALQLSQRCNRPLLVLTYSVACSFLPLLIRALAIEWSVSINFIHAVENVNGWERGVCNLEDFLSIALSIRNGEDVQKIIIYTRNLAVAPKLRDIVQLGYCKVVV